jgi:predicted regulator of Ras-like GTPase activity (Roadblock/LC7/MglB family)
MLLNKTRNKQEKEMIKALIYNINHDYLYIYVTHDKISYGDLEIEMKEVQSF